jgi:hypothetical protein
MDDRKIDLQVKRSVVLGFSQRNASLVTNLLRQKLQRDEDDNNWFLVENFWSEGADSLTFDSKHVQLKNQQYTNLHYLVGAEDFRNNVYPTFLASILATGNGAYFIVFPLASFSHDEMSEQTFNLVEKIFEAVAVIADRANANKQQCELILLGTHQESSDEKIKSLVQNATSRLGIIHTCCVDDSSFLRIEVNPDTDDIIWDINVLGSDSCEIYDEMDVIPFELPFHLDWIKAYVQTTASSDYKKKQALDLKTCNRKLDKLNVSNLDGMWKTFNILGWFLVQKNKVLSPPYMCHVIQKLVERKGTWLLSQTPAMELLTDRGLAMKFSGILKVMSLHPSADKRDCASRPGSAANLYLAIVVDKCIIPLSINQFWKMIIAIKNHPASQWDYTQIEYRDYVKLLYSVYEVHLSVCHGIVEVTLRKLTVVEGKHTIYNFANTCHKIREDLCQALIAVTRFKTNIKWGFACENIGGSNECKCIQVRVKSDIDSSFRCVCETTHDNQATLTLQHKVWFLNLKNQSSKLQVDNDIFVVPDNEHDAGNEDKAGSTPTTSTNPPVSYRFIYEPWKSPPQHSRHYSSWI